jgi:hypothetical protein
MLIFVATFLQTGYNSNVPPFLGEWLRNISTTLEKNLEAA